MLPSGSPGAVAAIQSDAPRVACIFDGRAAKTNIFPDVEEGAQSLQLFLNVDIVGKQPCSLSGKPTFRFIGTDGKPMRALVSSGSTPESAFERVVTPGQHLQIALFWSRLQEPGGDCARLLIMSLGQQQAYLRTTDGSCIAVPPGRGGKPGVLTLLPTSYTVV